MNQTIERTEAMKILSQVVINETREVTATMLKEALSDILPIISYYISEESRQMYEDVDIITDKIPLVLYSILNTAFPNADILVGELTPIKDNEYTFMSPYLKGEYFTDNIILSERLGPDVKCVVAINNYIVAGSFKFKYLESGIHFDNAVPRLIIGEIIRYKKS